jgi:Domain of unknown function (DUF4440)
MVLRQILPCLLLIASAGLAADQPTAAPAPAISALDQKLLTLSRDKWRWMADRDMPALTALFDDRAVFVHMGGAWGTKAELEIIRSGQIHYKHAEIKEDSVRFIGPTAIVLSRIRLTAVVGGNEVVNPFTVTEVYVKQRGRWKLGSLSFTRMLSE